MGHWIVRGAIIAIGSLIVLRAVLGLIVAIRERVRVDFVLALNLLTSAAFGLLLAASAATGNINFAWAAVVVLAFQWVVRGVERLLGAPEPD
jgi:hypothetical protein